MRSTSSSKNKGKQNDNGVLQDTIQDGDSVRVMPMMYRPVAHDTIQTHSDEPGFETSTTSKQGRIRSVSRTRTELSTAGRFSSERDPRFSPSTSGGSALATENSPYNNYTPAKLTNRSRTRSLEERRYSTGHLLNCVPEDTEMSLDPRGRDVRLSISSQRYGSINVGTAYPASLEMEEVGELDEDEEECILDEELANSGLYRGNYRNMMLLYTFVPLTTLFTFVVLLILPVFAFRSSATSTFPYPPYLPFPLPEFFTAAALWCFSYILREILHEISIFLISWISFSTPVFPSLMPFLASLFSNILQNSSALVLRQLAVPILLVPFYSTDKPRIEPHDGLLYTPRNFPTWEDVAFKRVWWIALGWAAAEAVVGIKQGYENIALYKDVLVNVRKETEETNPVTSAVESTSGPGTSLDETPTQRRFEGRSRPLAEGDVQNNPETHRRREHSSSLSSVGSAGRNEDMGVSPTFGERQPLLSLNRPPRSGSPVITRSAADENGHLTIEDEVEQDLQELMHIKTREELEELYGMPVIRIPIFISCLHRINCILSSLSTCLILTAAYMRSTLAYNYSSVGSPLRSFLFRLPLFSPIENLAIQSSNPAQENPHFFMPSNGELFLSFSVLLAIQILFSVMHTPWILPRVGVHTFVYVGFLVWLGIFFAALGFWEALT